MCDTAILAFWHRKPKFFSWLQIYPPPRIFQIFGVTIRELGGKISAYHINMRSGGRGVAIKKLGRRTSQQTALTQWTQTIINFLHHKISISLLLCPAVMHIYCASVGWRSGFLINLLPTAGSPFCITYFNLFLAISICFWCKYMTINLMFQTKNTYSPISKNYWQVNICFIACKTARCLIVL